MRGRLKEDGNDKGNSDESRIVLLTALLAVVCTAPVAAQQTTGNVRGVVADPNGAAVPNARVRITNRQTKMPQD